MIMDRLKVRPRKGLDFKTILRYSLGIILLHYYLNPRTIKLKQTSIIPVKDKLLLVILSLIGTGIIFFATSNYGAGISPDSVGYIATARHIADGIGIITYNNTPLIAQPPLYPAILGAIDFAFGVDPLLSANIVNAILFGLTLYLSGLLFSKYLTSSPYFALLGTVSLLVSIPLIKVSLMTWSEPLFICFIVFYLFFLSIYSENKNINSLLLLALSVALACLTRYIGVILVFTGTASILLIRQDNRKAKLLHVLIFVSLSVLPIGIWVTRNYILSGTLFGPRAQSLYTLVDNLSFTFDTILLWYLPRRITYSRPILMTLGILSGFLLGLIFVWTKTSITKLLKQTRPYLIFVLFVIISYSGFLVITSTTTAFDQIGTRLLSPIVVPMTLLLLSVIERLSKPITVKFPTKPAAQIIIFLFVLWLAYPARATVLNITNHLYEGEGYSAKSWRNSQTMQYISEKNLSNCTIYSNGPDVVYLLININVKKIPSKSSGANVIADLSSLKDSWPQENKVCIVWFNSCQLKKGYAT